MRVQLPLHWEAYQSSSGEMFFAKRVGHGFRLVPFTLTRDVGGTLLTNLVLLYIYVQDKGAGVWNIHLPAHTKPIWAAQHNFRGGNLFGARVHHTPDPCNHVRVVGRNGIEVTVPWE